MFDKRELYKEEIEPLVEQLRKSCIECGIPTAMFFAIADDGVTTEYANDCAIPAGDGDIKLTQDRLSPMLGVLNGCRITTNYDEPEYVEMESDDFLWELEAEIEAKIEKKKQNIIKEVEQATDTKTEKKPRKKRKSKTD